MHSQPKIKEATLKTEMKRPRQSEDKCCGKEREREKAIGKRRERKMERKRDCQEREGDAASVSSYTVQGTDT